MTVEVKICGIKSEPALDAALAGGADYIGLVFFPPSPRHIAPAAAAALAARVRGRAKVVALMVDPDDALIEEVVTTVNPDILQLHGTETPERVRKIRRRWNKPLMKAVHVEGAEDVATAVHYHGAADLILFDARAPQDSTRPGGNGAPFDWRILSAVNGAYRYVLSGGLTPENVAEALAATGAPIVDVSSGVEVRPGEKDVVLIARFLHAAKASASKVPG